MSNKSVILNKSGGFYQTFGEDSLIIGYLFDYKVNNNRCGFPLIALNKVINELEDKKINYVVKDKEEIYKDFKRKNKYDLYLEKGKVKSNINNRIYNILEKIKQMDYKDLEILLNLIEDKINE